MDLQQPPPHLRHPPPRRLISCHRHPGETPTGLCAPCLRERLSLLNPEPHISASAVGSSSSSSILPELRRCKTFNGNLRDAIELSYEPRRYSCDVRGRSSSSLWTLFNIEDEEFGVESRNLGFRGGTCPVLELKEDEEADGIEGNESDESDGGDEIRPVKDETRVFECTIEPDLGVSGGICVGFEESKRIKEFIELEFKSRRDRNRKRDLRDIAGSFLSAASVFSGKLRRLRPRGKSGRRGGDGCTVEEDESNVGEMQIDKLRGRRLRETQSEIGDYGFGRRSCDTDPRCSVDLGRASVDDGGRVWLDHLLGRRSCDTDSKFSIDLGRASIDGGRNSISEAAAVAAAAGRCSFEPPRASWDGRMAAARGAAAVTPTVSVIENAMATVYGFNNSSSMVEEKMNIANGDGHYMNGSWQRQKKGFDYCKTTNHEDEPRLMTSNGKMSPASLEIFHGARLLIPEKEMKDSACVSSLEEDDSLGSSESTSKDVPPSSVSKRGKKCRKWSKLWSILGLLQPGNRAKFGEQEKFKRGGTPDCPLGDSSWKIPKLVRSYSSNNAPGPLHGMMSSSSRSTSTTSGRSSKRREDPVVERYHNRSARYSPGALDSGLLRFNLTPLKTYRRRSGVEKGRLKRSPSMARSMFRLY